MVLPLLGYRAFLYSKQRLVLHPSELDGERVHGSRGLTFPAKWGIYIGIYAVLTLYYGYRWWSC
jgi:hypothetical protein